MRNALIRAGRTFLQTALGVYIAGVGAQGAGSTFEGLADLGVLEAAGAAGFVALLSFAQNALEHQRPPRYNRG